MATKSLTEPIGTHNILSRAIKTATISGPELRIKLKGDTPLETAKELLFDIRETAKNLAKENDLNGLFYGNETMYKLTPDLLFVSSGKIDFRYVPSEHELTVYANDLTGMKLNEMLKDKIIVPAGIV